jgi:hypothetical protein
MSLRNVLVHPVAGLCAQAWAADVALVMSVQGKVLRQDGANSGAAGSLRQAQ